MTTHLVDQLVSYNVPQPPDYAELLQAALVVSYLIKGQISVKYFTSSQRRRPRDAKRTTYEIEAKQISAPDR